MLLWRLSIYGTAGRALFRQLACPLCMLTCSAPPLPVPACPALPALLPACRCGNMAAIMEVDEHMNKSFSQASHRQRGRRGP